MAEDISSSVAWRLQKAIAGTIRGDVPQSGTARVQRRDSDGTVWLRLPGSSVDTPVTGAVVASVSAGDVVSYTIGGGKVAISGNATQPSVGERVVQNIVKPVRKIAQEAKGIAAATGQYFWHDDNGAHVSTEENNPAGARNALWNSLGMLFRAGATNLLAIVAGEDPGMDVYDGGGNEDENVIASYRGSGSRIGYLDGFNSIVQAGLFAIRHATDRLFSVTTDGYSVGVYMGGTIAPTGVNYTDAFAEATLRFLQDGCTVSDGIVYAPDGTDTGFTVTAQGFVKDGNGRSFSSASYSDIGYLNGSFYLEPQLSPMQETQAVPVSIDMGNANVSANDGRLTVTGSTTVKGSVSANNLCEVNATRSLGTGGTARAYRVGSLLVITGTYTGCTVGTAGTWVDLCTVYAPAINVTGTVTKLGCIADVSGGGAGFDGDINAGLHITSGTLQVLVQFTTNKAFSDRTVRFIAMAQVS